MDLYNLVVSAKLSKGGGGGDEPVLIDKTISENGVYKASDDSADGYKKVTVSVPSSGITPTGTSTITSNGIYDITNFASVDVNVSGGGDHDVEDGIIQRTISGAYENSRVTSIGNIAFNGCSTLTAVSFPSVTSIGGNAFYSCFALTTASFPSVTSIGNQAFRYCSALMSAYFLASSVATLGTSVFQYTPMSNNTYTGSFGSIYVPASLVDAYKSATNWSAYSARITAYVE